MVSEAALANARQPNQRQIARFLRRKHPVLKHLQATAAANETAPARYAAIGDKRILKIGWHRSCSLLPSKEPLFEQPYTNAIVLPLLPLDNIPIHQVFQNGINRIPCLTSNTITTTRSSTTVGRYRHQYLLRILSRDGVRGNITRANQIVEVRPIEWVRAPQQFTLHLLYIGLCHQPGTLAIHILNQAVTDDLDI